MSVEVAHEALIRGWGQLRQWVEADRAGLRTHRRLTETAREREQHDRDPELLFTSARPATAREWSDLHPGELSPAEVDFLAAGISAERRKRDDEADRARRLAEAEADRAREAFARVQEHVRNLRRFGLAVGLVLAVHLIGLACWEYNRARIATSRAHDEAELARAAQQKAAKQAKNATDAEARAKE